MPEVTAVIDAGSANARRMTATKNRELNDNFIFTSDANLTHVPKFWVGIFNVADFEHRIERPWVHPQRMGQLIVIPACEPGQEYSKPFVIPDIVQMKSERPGSWELSTRGADGRFLAQDAINPEDPTGNWKTVRESGTGGISMNEGTNLYMYGCFWATAPTIEELKPTAEELAAAHRRLEATYNRLVAEATLLSMQGARGIEQIGSLHRRADNYFGGTSAWNAVYKRKTPCPNCGEPLIQNAAVCTKCPAVLDWQKALDLGLRTMKQAIEAGIIEPQAEHMGRGKRKAQEA